MSNDNGCSIDLSNVEYPMTVTMFENSFWRYYLGLEKRFINSTNYND